MNNQIQHRSSGLTRFHSIMNVNSLSKFINPDHRSILFLTVITFVVAACSILYELLLAQTLSTIMGNTIFRYNLTIGIYIASMGLGALYYSRLNPAKMKANLICTEIILAIVGMMAPILVLMVEYLFQKFHSSNLLPYQHWFTQCFIFLFNHGLILAIGFISGLELPLLMNLSKQFQPHYSNKILTVDYFGTIIGSILFPIILVPFLNLFTIAQVIGMINAVMALLLARWLLPAIRKWQIISGLLAIFLLLVLLFANSINHWIIETFYYG